MVRKTFYGTRDGVYGRVEYLSRPKSPQLAFTVAYYRRLIAGLNIKAAYTVDSFSFSNLGIGLNAELGALNFYAMADNFLNYSNLAKAQSISLQFGMNYVVRRKND